MKKRYLPLILAAGVATLSGCSLFKEQPPEDKAAAAEKARIDKIEMGKQQIASEMVKGLKAGEQKSYTTQDGHTFNVIGLGSAISCGHMGSMDEKIYQGRVEELDEAKRLVRTFPVKGGILVNECY